MQIDEVRQLSSWLAATDIELLELRGPDRELCLRREGAQMVVVAAESFAVTAPGVGVLLHVHPLRPEALVHIGERVRAGQVVALLKIGALLLPVKAPRDGIALGPLVADGAIVGFGTPVLEMSAL